MKISVLAVLFSVVFYSPLLVAEKPDPVNNPPLQIREQNLDASGWIAVHEQGTAEVHVEGGQVDANITGGSVEVSNTDSNPVPVNVKNFPAEQPVFVNEGTLSSVSRAFHAEMDAESGGGTWDHSFSVPIHATTIVIANRSEDEFDLTITTTLGGAVMHITDFDGVIPMHHYSFTYPVPINSLHLYCANESELCGPLLTIVGF